MANSVIITIDDSKKRLRFGERLASGSMYSVQVQGGSFDEGGSLTIFLPDCKTIAADCSLDGGGSGNLDLNTVPIVNIASELGIGAVFDLPCMAWNGTAGSTGLVGQGVCRIVSSGAAAGGNPPETVSPVLYQGPQGERGQPGPTGPAGGFFIPSVSEDGVVSWRPSDPNDTALQAIQPAPRSIKGPRGPAGRDGRDGHTGPDGRAGQDGAPGRAGAFFIPSVSEAGVLSWTASDPSAAGSTPPDRNVVGPRGATGEVVIPMLNADGVLSWRCNDSSVVLPSARSIRGDAGPSGADGPQGRRGPPGPPGTLYYAWNADHTLAYRVTAVNQGEGTGDIVLAVDQNGVSDPEFATGPKGDSGATFYPQVTDNVGGAGTGDGTVMLHWRNDAGDGGQNLENLNPAPINIRGPAAATVDAGPTETLGSDRDATVENTGNTTHAVLKFGIPRGRAATVAVGTVTAGGPDDGASVVNAGTAEDAVFNFVLPKGDKGDTGERGPAGGPYFTPALQDNSASDGTVMLSWGNNAGPGGADDTSLNPSPVNVRGRDGALFTPVVTDNTSGPSSDGTVVLSWANNAGSGYSNDPGKNPAPVNIRGAPGRNAVIWTPNITRDGAGTPFLNWTNDGGLSNPPPAALGVQMRYRKYSYTTLFYGGGSMTDGNDLYRMNARPSGYEDEPEQHVFQITPSFGSLDDWNLLSWDVRLRFFSRSIFCDPQNTKQDGIFTFQTQIYTVLTGARNILFNSGEEKLALPGWKDATGGKEILKEVCLGRAGRYVQNLSEMPTLFKENSHLSVSCHFGAGWHLEVLGSEHTKNADKGFLVEVSVTGEGIVPVVE